MNAHYRVGRKVGRTIYRINGITGEEELIGMMDTPELARAAVAAWNSVDAVVADNTALRSALRNLLARIEHLDFSGVEFDDARAALDGRELSEEGKLEGMSEALAVVERENGPLIHRNYVVWGFRQGWLAHYPKRSAS